MYAQQLLIASCCCWLLLGGGGNGGGGGVSARPQRLQHIAVIENDAYEQTLPPELRNPFYKTPRVREALAKSSWFGPGELPVYDRQAEKIPRAEIYNVLVHAGLIPYKRRYF